MGPPGTAGSSPPQRRRQGKGIGQKPHSSVRVAGKTSVPHVVLSPSADGYPVRHRLFSGLVRAVEVMGDPACLSGRRSVAFIASERIPGELILRTYDFMRRRSPDGPAFVSGFHSPMERQCLELLLARRVPVVICPARSLRRMRVPLVWRPALKEGRLMIASGNLGSSRRPTVRLATARNLFCASLADEAFIPYAAPGGKTERLAQDLVSAGMPLMTLGHTDTRALVVLGARLVDEGPDREIGAEPAAPGEPLFSF
jgi:hypothetical protein